MNWITVEVSTFDDERLRDASHPAPVLLAALDGAPDPVSGVRVHPRRVGGSGSRQPRHPRPVRGGGSAAPYPDRVVRMSALPAAPASPGRPAG